MLVVMAVTMTFTACKDETSNPSPSGNTNKTNTDLLVNAEWLLRGGTIVPPVEIDFNGTKIQLDDYWQLIALQNQETEAPNCARDNLMIFYRDSTLELNEGPTRCDPSDPQVQEGGNWQFEEDETKIRFSSFPLDPTGEERLVDVVKLTSDSLSLKMNYTLLDPFTQQSSQHVIDLWMENKK